MGFNSYSAQNFGFPPIFLNWIMACLSTATFAIFLNCRHYDQFASTRGLRQGDPFYHFLFIIGTELLSQLLHREEQRTNLKGLKVGSRGPSLTHLLFVDDLILFGHASAREIRVFLRCLKKYQTSSGQSINPVKSSILLSPNTANVTT